MFSAILLCVCYRSTDLFVRISGYPINNSDYLLFVTGHLIGLLESLGTLSITAIELKQLIGLLRLDEEDNQVLLVGMGLVVDAKLVDYSQAMVVWWLSG